MCRPLSQGGRRCPGKGGEYRRAQARRRYHERKARDEFAQTFGAAHVPDGPNPVPVDLERMPKTIADLQGVYGDEAARVRDEAAAMVPAALATAREAATRLKSVPTTQVVPGREENAVRSKMYAAATRYANAVKKHGEDSDKAAKAKANYEKWNTALEETLGNSPERIAAEREYVKAAQELGTVIETSLVAAALAEYDQAVYPDDTAWFRGLSNGEADRLVDEAIEDNTAVRMKKGEEREVAESAIRKSIAACHSGEIDNVWRGCHFVEGLTERESAWLGDNALIANNVYKAAVRDGYEEYKEQQVFPDSRRAWTDQMKKLGLDPADSTAIHNLSVDPSRRKEWEEKIDKVTGVFPAAALEKFGGIHMAWVSEKRVRAYHTTWADKTDVSINDLGEDEEVLTFYPMVSLSQDTLREEYRDYTRGDEIKDRLNYLENTGQDDYLGEYGDLLDEERKIKRRRNRDDAVGVDYASQASKPHVRLGDTDSIRRHLETPPNIGYSASLRASSLPATDENRELMEWYGKKNHMAVASFTDHEGRERLAFGERETGDDLFSWRSSFKESTGELSHRVVLDVGDSEAVLAHEIGHAFEYHDPEMLAATKRYVLDNSYGSSYEVLARSKRHGRELVSTSGNFASAYESKVYSGWSATEVMSMGMQYVEEMFKPTGGVGGAVSEAATSRNMFASENDSWQEKRTATRRLALGLIARMALGDDEIQGDN